MIFPTGYLKVKQWDFIFVDILLKDLQFFFTFSRIGKSILYYVMISNF